MWGKLNMILKSIYQATLLGVLGLFLYGCGSSGIHVVTYAEDKLRVDQEISGVNNQGYIGGSMISDNIAERRNTRKVYVMEVSKGAGDVQPVEEAQASFPEQSAPGAGAAKTDGHPVQYTVEKDDTLQKISQKFYNSYGKWTRIYEANKPAISDPDRIKPGTILQIPVD